MLDLKEILARVQLPALPESAMRVLELSQDPTNGPAEFAVPIESDLGLAGQVLRLVNSSYYGFSREIPSVRLAITLVGVRTIEKFVLWNAVFSLMPNPKCGPFDLKSLWQDSLRRALFARHMGKLLGMKDAEEPFAAALLQDMAIPILAKAAPEMYVKLLGTRDDGRLRLSYLEEQMFGWNHARAAGVMARHWNLPDSFAILVETHQEIDRGACEPEVEPGKLTVSLSALLPPAADPTWYECGLFEGYYQRFAPAGGPAVVELLGKIDREFAQFAPVLALSTPTKSLVDSFNEMATAAR